MSTPNLSDRLELWRAQALAAECPFVGRGHPLADTCKAVDLPFRAISIVAVTDAAGQRPFSIVKRTVIPMLGGGIVVIVLTWLSGGG